MNSPYSVNKNIVITSAWVFIIFNTCLKKQFFVRCLIPKVSSDQNSKRNILRNEAKMRKPAISVHIFTQYDHNSYLYR